MDEQGLREWIKQRLEEGEDATVYEFMREVLDRGVNDRQLLDSSVAKNDEYEGRVRELEEEIKRLKSHNYDLLMNGGVVDDVNSGDGEVEEHAEDDAEIIHIDNLFEEEDDE